jgi:hypothetical protein
MQENLLSGPCKALSCNPFPSKFLLLTYVLLVITIFLSGCAILKQSGPKKYLTKEDMQNIMEETRVQGEMVSQFYFTGTISMKGWIMDRSAGILIAGKKEPLTIKIEITHSWGKPFFHLLIRDERLSIIDFMEKKQYEGRFTPENLSGFLPEMDCTPDMIWSFLRGYPKYSDVYRINEDKAGVITIEGNDEKIVGTITVSPEKEIKEAAVITQGFPDISFSDFIMAGDISYAAETLLEDRSEDRDMTLKRKKVVFNKDIPDEIFTLKPMAAFEAVNIDEMH